MPVCTGFIGMRWRILNTRDRRTRPMPVRNRSPWRDVPATTCRPVQQGASSSDPHAPASTARRPGEYPQEHPRCCLTTGLSAEPCVRAKIARNGSPATGLMQLLQIIGPDIPTWGCPEPRGCRSHDRVGVRAKRSRFICATRPQAMARKLLKNCWQCFMALPTAPYVSEATAPPVMT